MRTAGGRWGREMLVWGQGLGAGGQGGGCGWQAPGRKGQRAPGGCLSSCRRTRQVPDVGGGQLVAGLLELDEGRGVEAVVAAANVVDLSTRQGREGGGDTGWGGEARRDGRRWITSRASPPTTPPPHLPQAHYTGCHCAAHANCCSHQRRRSRTLLLVRYVSSPFLIMKTRR